MGKGKKRSYSGYTKKTAEHLLLDAGAFFKNFTYEYYIYIISSFSFLSYAFFSPSSATTFAQSFARSSMLSARAYSLSVWFH